ncbi:MAG: 1-acyl-sn-glycerol-3-phosphate acyltransferase [Actinomycetota bacterium]|nr:1-acyl-sn-glycerol-3-phosphate acyltransferase [Actinomycetota bacterium]
MTGTMTPIYRAVVTLTAPIMRPWSRMRVTGLHHVPVSGPTLLVANHDSYWDPVAIGVALRRRRQVRALSKSTIWKVRAIGWVMDGMGHIPIERGTGDIAALRNAITQLAAGACIGIFPEGTRSLGRPLRAHSGVGRLALAVPDAVIVCARVRGTVDVVRAPQRPRVSVEFFAPSGGQVQASETPAQLSARLLTETRDGAPPVVPGRRRTAGKHRRRLEAP